MADNRFLEDPEDKKYTIERIWDHHENIINLLVATNGIMKNKEIADQIGCTEQTVSNVRNNPMVRAKIEAMQGQANENAVDVGKKIKELFPMAAKVLENTMALVGDEEDIVNADPRIISQAVRAANTIIDHAHPKQTQGTVIHGHMTLSKINEIKNKVRDEMETGAAEAEFEDIPNSEQSLEEVA